MGKPRLIILIRHAQSEGNKNRDIHQTVPDHRVTLTPEGWKQAEEAGRKLRALLRPSDTLHFFTSPYRRTRETTEGILTALTASTPTPSPFPRHTIKVYEEPRLREQDFGNFQPSSAEMTRMWHERAEYGHFFYRIPQGESAADAYDRVSGFNESLWRSFGEADFASVCVLVTHGLMTRVFLMKWYHFSVEYFEDLRNVNHCEFVVMRLQPDSGRYVLQNQLRTWSELREEHRQKESGSPTVPVRKKWGGCPEGCEHAGEGRRIKGRQNTVDLFREEGGLEEVAMALQRKGSRIDVGTESLMKEVEDDPQGCIFPPLPDAANGDAGENGTTSQQQTRNGKPIAPHPVVPDDRLEILATGRDGGGSQSGAASQEGSSDSEEGEQQVVARELRQMRKRFPRSMALALKGELEVEPGMRTGARADALGDQSTDEEDELERREMEDRSFEGSVR